MASRSPFNFDISVSADKRRRQKGRRGMSGAIDTSTHACAAPGCKSPGKYRAPRSPDHLDEYVWFCLEHVREYNLKWNFFQGQTDADFEARMNSDRVWERPTEPFSRNTERRAWSRLGVNDPMDILGDKGTRRAPDPARAARRLPPNERRALEILDARDSWSKAEVRRQYKSLVKDLHPDMNGGNRADEDRLQEVVWAWEQIRISRSFPD